MTTKHLVGTYASGYGLHGPTTNLIIGAGADVGGPGVYTLAADTGAYTIVNLGQIVGAAVSGDHGVYLGHGGVVTNGAAGDTTALIQGYEGVVIAGAAGAVTNFGTIIGYGAGVTLEAGGTVTNGSQTSTGALIESSSYSYGVVIDNAAGAVSNFGTVTSGLDGVLLSAGGAVTNGSAADTGAMIYGAADGVVIGGQAGAITNFGAISGGEGVALEAGGSVVNGSKTDTGARIHALYNSAVYVGGGAGSVTNFGTIAAYGGSFYGHQFGILLDAGGAVTNGSKTDTGALIYGLGQFADGVVIQNGAGTVTNFGFIVGGQSGVRLFAGGAVTNGDATDTGAVISGFYRAGVYGAGGATTVTNFGTIGGSDGVLLAQGGAIINGSNADTGAYIAGNALAAVYIGGRATATVTNFGTIAGGGVLGVLQRAGNTLTLTNGSAADSAALIQAQAAAYFGGAGSVANYGTLAGVYVGVEFRNAAGSVTNFGRVTASDAGGDGVELVAGGTVTNGRANDPLATIQGYRGVAAYGSATVVNFGTIAGSGGGSGVKLAAGGAVTNGSGSDTLATITGYIGVRASGAGATVTNFGTIVGGQGGSGAAVIELAGGSVTNGSSTDTRALIQAARAGVYVAGGSGAVTNFGTVAGYFGVFLNAGGSVTNGSSADTGALIQGGYLGVVLQYGAGGTLTNFGTVTGGKYGVFLNAGGSVTNGSQGDTAAEIQGYRGVEFQGASGAVTNFGTLTGDVAAGVAEFAGGSVTNGSVTDTSALIQSAQTAAVGVAGASGAVTNFGTVAGYFGVELNAGGSVTNGAPTVTTAQIQGSYIGVVLQSGAGGTLTNFGTVTGGGFGVYLNSGGTVTNGAKPDRAALISGGIGVDEVGGGVTVVNFGTIAGTGGVAVSFSAASDVLAVQAGSTFVGSVLGGGGTLDLASGVGTVATNQAAGGLNAVVTGSMAPTTFTSFGTVEAGPGATFAVSGDGVVGVGQTLLADGGTLSFGNAITGVGTIAVEDGGSLLVEAAAAATLAMAFDSAGATLALATPSTFAATISGFAATDVIDLVKIKATAAVLGAGDTLAIMNGAATIATLQLAGGYAGAAFSVASDHHGGTDITVNVPGAWPAAAAIVSATAPMSAAAPGPSHHVFLQAMAGLARGDNGSPSLAVETPPPAALGLVKPAAHSG